MVDGTFSGTIGGDATFSPVATPLTSPFIQTNDPFAPQALDSMRQTARNFPSDRIILRAVDNVGNGVNFIATEQNTLMMMTNLITNTMFAYGWNTIVDVYGWCYGRDTVSGKLEINSNNFPHGIPWLVATLHSNNVRIDFYFDDITPAYTIPPFGPGYAGYIPQNYYSNDVVAFKSWGIDGFMWDNEGQGYVGYGPYFSREHIEDWGYWMRTIAPEIPFFCFGSGETNYDWLITSPTNYNVQYPGGYPVPITNYFQGTNNTFTAAHKLYNWRANSADCVKFFFDSIANANPFTNAVQGLYWSERAAQYGGVGSHISTFINFNEGGNVWGTNNNLDGLGKTAAGITFMCHNEIELDGNIGTGVTVYPQLLWYFTNTDMLNLQRDPWNNLPTRVVGMDQPGVGFVDDELIQGYNTHVSIFVNYGTGSTTFNLPLSYYGFASNTPVAVYDMWHRTNCLATNTFTVAEGPTNSDIFRFRVPNAEDIVNGVYSATLASPIISGIATGNITGNASGNAGAATNLLGTVGPSQVTGTLTNTTTGNAATATTSAALANASITGTNQWIGDEANPWYSLTSVATGVNYAIPIGSNQCIDISGPSGPFSVYGINAAGGSQRDGRWVELRNGTGYAFTIGENSGDPATTNRIVIGEGANVVLTNNPSFVRLRYRGPSSRWEVQWHSN